MERSCLVKYCENKTIWNERRVHSLQNTSVTWHSKCVRLPISWKGQVVDRKQWISMKKEKHISWYKNLINQRKKLKKRGFEWTKVSWSSWFSVVVWLKSQTPFTKPQRLPFSSISFVLWLYFLGVCSACAAGEMFERLESHSLWTREKLTRFDQVDWVMSTAHITVN